MIWIILCSPQLWTINIFELAIELSSAWTKYKYSSSTAFLCHVWLLWWS